jgi:hypothetical protein
LADDRPAVKGWNDLSVTEQLIVEGADPELASVLRNQMTAAVELGVLSGNFADVAPVVKSQAELREEAIAAWVAANPIPSPEEQAAQLRERQAENEASRINSYVNTYGRWGG